MSKRRREATPDSHQSPTKKTKDTSSPPLNSKKSSANNAGGHQAVEESTAAPTQSQRTATVQRDVSTQNLSHESEDTWELLDGDSRERLVVGVAEPKRLTLRVQNRNTKEIRRYQYSRDPESIDWNDLDQIRGIMRFRNQVFQRLQFPLLQKMSRWSEEEVKFLTLVCEKFVLAVTENRAISLPHNAEIFDIFTRRFGDNHSRGTFDSRFRRKDGSHLSQLKDRLEGKLGDLRPTGGPKFQLSIVEGELEAYMDKEYVTLHFSAKAYQKWLAGDSDPLESNQEMESSNTADNNVLSSKKQSPGKIYVAESQAMIPNARVNCCDTSAESYNQIEAHNAWLSVVMGDFEPNDHSTNVDSTVDPAATTSAKDK